VRRKHRSWPLRWPRRTEQATNRWYPRPPIEKKSTFMGSTSNQPAADQLADDKKNGAIDKEVPVDPNDADKKLRLSTELNTK
jgi:hypothetical protein